MRCAVVGCNSDNQSKRNPCKDVKYFSFPKDVNLSKKWLYLTKRDKVNLKNAVICSKHFCESDYKVNLKHILLGYTPKNHRGLKDDAIPTQNLPQFQCISLSLSGPSTSGARENRNIVFEKRQRVAPRAELIKDIKAKDTGEDLTESTPEPEMNKERNDIRDGQNLDCNMVNPSANSEIGVHTNENVNVLKRRLLEVTRENEKLKYQLAAITKNVW